MAQLAIAVAVSYGASAAATALGASVAVAAFAGQMGFLAGSAIGASFAPTQHIEGASLADLKVTGTDYGQCIPYLIGTPRTAGQLWWASDRRKVAHTTESGGKGGGGGVSQTNYTYDVDLLIGLSDNELAGLLQVFDNGKLVWTPESPNTDLWERITFYTGAADQLPDPTYEAAVGTANAPAYRGRGYVFIQGMHLDGSGALHNLTIVVASKGTLSDPAAATHWGNWDSGNAGSLKVIPGTSKFFTIDSGTLGVTLWDASTKTALQTYTSGWTNTNDSILAIGYCPVTNTLWMGNAPSRPQMFRVFDAATGALLFGSGTYGYFNDILFNDVTNKMYTPNGYVIDIHSYAVSAVSPPLTGTGLSLPGEKYLFIKSGASTVGLLNKQGYSLAYTKVFASTVFSAYDPVKHRMLFVHNQGSSSGIYSLPLIDWVLFRSAPLKHVADIAYSTPTLAAFSATENLFWCGFGSTMVGINPDTGAVERTHTSSGNPAPNDLCAFIDPSHPMQMQVAGDSTLFYQIPLGSELVPEDVTLQEAVTAICLRASLASGQFDASALAAITKPVRALAISQISPTRSTLEMLMASYFFEMHCRDKIYYVPRGGSSVLTLAYDELGASADGNFAEPLLIKERTDIELPAMFEVTYMNMLNDQQTDVQQSDRIVTALSNTVQSVQIPMGFTPAEAKGIAQTLALDAQVARHGTSIAVLGTHAKLETTDVFTVTGQDGSAYRMRATGRTDSYPLLEFDAVLDDASVLIHEGITGTDYASSTSVVPPVGTVVELLDIPLLRDADNDAGFIVAAQGDADGWPGANIYSSADNVDYALEGAITSSAVFGGCLSALGDWNGPRVFDEVNLVTVYLGSGVVAGVARDALLNDSRVNAFLIGDEIIQARDANLIAAGTYILSGLLRGGRGTEWAMTGHAAGERCVLLQSAGMRHIPLGMDKLGVQRWYKGVTLGRRLSSAPANAFTCNGIALKPFSPFDLRATRDGSGNITFTCQRRTRMAVRTIGALGISIPLGEDTEAYDVQIYSDGTYATLLRTLTTTTTSCPYSAADQTTDFGSLQNPVFVCWQQRSAQVGLGYKLEDFA